MSRRVAPSPPARLHEAVVTGAVSKLVEPGSPHETMRLMLAARDQLWASSISGLNRTLSELNASLQAGH